MLDPLPLTIFMLTAFVASYIQTVTGFAYGLILVGASSGLQLVSIEVAAIVVSFTSLVNVVVALRGCRQDIRWPTVIATLTGLLPAMVAGVLILGYLSNSAAATLKLLLGMTILAAGVMLVFKPHPYPSSSPNWSFSLAGMIGGLTGGLFSVAGPPIVFHLYRQPVLLAHLKTTLFFIFAVSTLSRILVVGYQGLISQEILLTSALVTPFVILATLLGKRFPPPLGELAIKRFCFLLLSIMGLSLILV